jgi:hypothetical protein
MPVLVTGIHVLLSLGCKDVDGRVKPGQDEFVVPPAFLFGNPARGHRSFTIPAYGESRLKRGSLRLKLRWGGVRVA